MLDTAVHIDCGGSLMAYFQDPSNHQGCRSVAEFQHELSGLIEASASDSINSPEVKNNLIFHAFHDMLV
jgi:hypothetical protein